MTNYVPAMRTTNARATLMGGAAFGAAVLAMTALSPSQALAADECGAQTTNTVNCTSAGNPFAGGIVYTPTADLTVALDGTVAVNSAGAGVIITPTNFNSTVTTAGTTTITATGMGISVTTGNANATINNAGAVTSGDTALNATVLGTGDATVTNGGALSVTSATFGASGIMASTTDGDASVTNGGAITVGGTSAYLNGIVANAAGGTGLASIDHSGTINVTANGFAAIGLNASGYNGVSITGGGNVTVDNAGGYALGVQAQSAKGNVTINVGDVVASGYSAQGIALLSGDSTATVSVTFHDVTANTTGQNGGDGLNIYASSGAGVSITGHNVTTTGDYTDGIKVGGGGGIAGATTINVNSVSTTGYRSAGVVVGGHSTINAGAVNVTTTGDYANGIDVHSDGGAVGVTSTGTISTTGYGSRGVNANATGGNAVNVGVNNVTTTNGNATGVYASSDTGVVTITSTGTVSTTGAGAIALQGYSVGDVNINLVNASTASDFTPAIDAHSGGGNVKVISTGTISTTGYASYGVNAVADTGNVSVAVSKVTTIGNYSYGVYANAANGAATVKATSITTTGNGAQGIHVYGYAGVSVTSGTIKTSGVYATGIDASSDDSAVSVTSTSITTTGPSADGIFAHADGGTVSVNGGSVTTSGPNSDGIHATANAGYVYVTSAGTIVTSGAGSFGIDASATTGNVYVTAANVKSSGPGADAIRATTTKGGFVGVYTTPGSISSTTGSGIHVVSTGGAFINVAKGSSVYGGAAGVTSSATGGTTIYNYGTLGGGGGLAVNVTSGTTYLANIGTVNGHVTFSAAADNFTNYGTFNATGTSAFGGGADVFNNKAGGTIRVAPAAGSPTTVTFSGLEAMNSAGTIDLRNGHSGDVLALPGTVFTGSGASTLSVDIDLAAGTADQLQFGTGAGVTTVNATRIGSSFGTFGETVPVAVGSSATPASAFVLGGGKIDTGFVQFTMQFNSATNTFALVGSPDVESFEAGRAALAGQIFWANTADVWQARTQEMRDSMWSGDPTRGEGWELWSQAHAGSQDVQSQRTFTAFGTTTTPNLGLDTDWRGFQMGADKVSGSMMWGVTAGFTQQESRLHFDRNSFDLEGWNIGAYAGFTSGHFFLNGLVKGDWYSVDANFHTASVFDSFNGNTWGVVGETGLRFGGAHFWMEPVASAEYSSTHLDGFSGAGVTVDYGNSSLWKGKAGARFGAEWGSIIPYVGVYAVDTWSGNNNVTLTTGASSFTFSGEPVGSHGLVDFGFTTKSWNGLEGFLKGEDYFSGNVNGFTGRLGVRWRW
jgi:hypothetical protein